MSENKWDYEEICFTEIDLEPLRQGKPAKSFKYASDDKKSEFVISIFKSKKNGKYYAKVELAKKIVEETTSKKEDEGVPF